MRVLVLLLTVFFLNTNLLIAQEDDKEALDMTELNSNNPLKNTILPSLPALEGRDASKDLGNGDADFIQEVIGETPSTYMPPKASQEFVSASHNPKEISVLNNTLKGSVALYSVAISQTEPSIAAGLSNANRFTFSSMEWKNSVDRRYQEDLLSSNDKASLVALETHRNCIKLEDAKENVTHEVAIARCTADVAEAKSTEPEADNIKGIENNKFFVEVVSEIPGLNNSCANKMNYVDSVSSNRVKTINAIDVLYCRKLTGLSKYAGQLGPAEDFIINGLMEDEYKRFFEYYGSPYWTESLVKADYVQVNAPVIGYELAPKSFPATKTVEEIRNELLEKNWTALLNILYADCSQNTKDNQNKPEELSKSHEKAFWQNLPGEVEEHIKTLNNDALGIMFNGAKSKDLLKLYRYKTNLAQTKSCEHLKAVKDDIRVLASSEGVQNSELKPYLEVFSVYKNYAEFLANIQYNLQLRADIMYVAASFKGEKEESFIREALINSIRAKAIVFDIGGQIDKDVESLKYFMNSVAQLVKDYEKDFNEDRKKG